MERNEYVEVSLENCDRFRIKKDGHVYWLVIDEFGCDYWTWLDPGDVRHGNAKRAAFAELAERQAADERHEKSWDRVTPEPAPQPDDGEPAIKYDGWFDVLKIHDPPAWRWVYPGGEGVDSVVKNGVFHHIFDAAKRGLQKPESPVRNVDGEWFYAGDDLRTNRAGLVERRGGLDLPWYPVGRVVQHHERTIHAALFDAAKGSK